MLLHREDLGALEDESVAQQSGETVGSRSDTVLLLLITAIAAVLRLARLGSESFWIDEVSEARTASLIATHGWRAIASRDNVSPLSHVILAGVQQVFGRSEIAARLPGALAGIILVPVAYALGRRLFSGRVGLLVATLVAISPYAVWFARDARMYSYLSLASALYLWCFVAFVERPTRASAVGLVSLGIVGLYVHEYFIFVMVASTAWAAWSWIRSNRPRLFALVGMNALSCLAFVPWIVAVSAYDPGTAGSQRSGAIFFAPYTVVSYFIGFTLGPSIREMQRLGALSAMRDHVGAMVIPMLLLGATLAVVAWAARGRKPERPGTPGLGLLGVLAVALIVLPVLAGTVTDTVNFNVRYCAGAVVPVMILVAASFDRLRSRSIVTAVLVALVAMMTFASIRAVFPGDEYAREDIRATAHELRRLHPRGPVLVESPTIVEGLRWYGYRGPVIAVRDTQARPVLAAARSQRVSGGEVTLVQAREWEFDPGDVVARDLTRAGFRITSSYTSAGARIHTYRYVPSF